MKHEIPVRITVVEPLANVTMMVQRGKNELLPPGQTSPDGLSFDFKITVDLAAGDPNFLGPFTQGPKSARFIYVNSGTYAGQHQTGWGRRAKLSLMNVTREQVNQILAKRGSRLETSINGVGADGGPTCATVKGLQWKVV
jgi:hypothetical protein